MATIEITATPVKTIDIELVGVAYDVKPPKGALAIVLASKMAKSGEDPGLMMRAISDWVTMAFGKKVGKDVMSRLENADDELDLVHIMQLMQKLTEASTGNPTT